jgi:large subunit ribosomal protein L25
VDVSGLEVNGAVHISDLPHSGKIKFLGEEDALVAHVTLMKEEAEEVAAGPAEPEVAKKGKQDAEAAAPADKKK